MDATFAFVSAETMENVTTTRSVQLLVMADVKDVDIMLFECINGASLVYDGRIVVDGAFRTNDPSIFAAGTVARFSRSLALVWPGFSSGSFDLEGSRFAAIGAPSPILDRSPVPTLRCPHNSLRATGD